MMPRAASHIIKSKHPHTSDAAIRDSKASAEHVDVYNKFIWDLARNFTASDEEAKAAVEEMRADIRYCAENGVVVTTIEDRLTSEMAWRRLKKLVH